MIIVLLLNVFIISSALDLNIIKQMGNWKTTTRPEVLFQIVDPGTFLIDCQIGCPTGWKYYNSKCYKKFDISSNYENAKKNCEKNNGQLAIITSSELNDALKKEYDENIGGNKNQPWIGLKKNQNAWKWSDGSTASLLNWAPTEPTSGNCVQMITNTMKKAAYKFERGGWKSQSCSLISNSHICEKMANFQ